MNAQSWIRNTLELGAHHYRQSTHPETFTAQGLAEKEHVSGHHVAKVVAVVADGNTTLLVLPASRRVSLAQAREALGVSMLRLVSETEMALRFPDCEVGAIPPLRHWPQVDIVADETLVTEGEILFAAGNHRESIRMPFHEWRTLVGPRVAAFTVPGGA